ncbi:hypothetical protein ROS9278_02953 [Roseomonas sp. CECT 9278]|nr:hypothetical protein ROS9278_02953 [Roseomonas sp. CECT 9278]
MTVTVRVLFDQPQHEIASLLRDRLTRCRSASLVAGFMTSAGIEAIAAPLHGAPGKLSALVIGAGTYQAFQAFDGLLDAGVPPDRLHVHLGFSGPSGGKDNPFHRYRPMLHSKVYLMEMADGTASAFVGSHNLTGFALLGLNGEAGVLIDGAADEPEFVALRRHIAECVSQATAYDRDLKEAYAWWTTQYVDGLKVEIGRPPADAENKQTIVVLAARALGPLPTIGNVIYFEMSKALMEFNSLRPEVHIYVFDPLPATPAAALLQLDSAKAKLVCGIDGLQMERGGVELLADFHIDNRRQPDLKPATRPFRPRPAPGMQQVSVRVQGTIPGAFEYLFDRGKADWAPVYDDALVPLRSDGGQEVTVPADLLPRVGQRWLRVQGLQRVGPAAQEANQLVLWDADPSSGSFIVFSWRRRRGGQRGTERAGTGRPPGD